MQSRIATLGLNPSNREFVDCAGIELDGPDRRFHTLKSLSLDSWSDAKVSHLKMIEDSCNRYFSNNPYNGWFKKLDYIVSGARASYYDQSETACHLDLIPYATACKWTELNHRQRSALLEVSADALGLLLESSSIQLLILNGNSVINQFQEIAGIHLEKKTMADWTLPRRSGSGVTGFAYQGRIRNVSGIKLKNDVLVLGFNHNIQSSFGVTTKVTTAIRRWISKVSNEVIA